MPLSCNLQSAHLVPVPHSRHGDDCPPEPVWDAVDLGARHVELRVVDGAAEDEQADDEGDEEEAEALEARLEREDQHLVRRT